MTWKQVFTVGSVMVGGFLYLIYKSQEKILYLNEQIPPKRTSENPYPYKNPSQQFMNYKDVWLTTSDGLKLHAWFIPAAAGATNINDYSYSYSYNTNTNNINNNINNNNKLDTNTKNEEESKETVGTIVWFHANAGNMGFRLPNLLKMHKELGCNLFILSYRGYGESEGEPSEEGIKIDAETTMNYLLKKKDENELGIDPNKIFIFGRSLGGAVATYVASKYDSKICGMILENTFLSISDMVGKVFPFLNFSLIKKYMLKIHWRTIDLIPFVKCPILFVASEKDEIVPHSHMVQLFEQANSSSYKLMHKVKDGTHNDAWLDEKGGENYWNQMKRFIQKCMELKNNELLKQTMGEVDDTQSNGLKSEL